MPRRRSSSRSLLPKALRTSKQSSCSTYSMIEPPSVPVSRTAFATICSSTSCEVEAGADRLAHLAQRLELVHLGGQLGAAGLEGLHQPDVLDDDRGLRGEHAQQLDRALVERRHRGPPDGEHARPPRRRRSSAPTAACGSRPPPGGPGGRTPGRRARPRSAGSCGPGRHVRRRRPGRCSSSRGARPSSGRTPPCPSRTPGRCGRCRPRAGTAPRRRRRTATRRARRWCRGSRWGRPRPGRAR